MRNLTVSSHGYGTCENESELGSGENMIKE